MFFVLFDQPVVKPGEYRRGEEGGNHREFQQGAEGAVEPQNQRDAGGGCPQYPGEQFARAEIGFAAHQAHGFDDCARVAVNNGDGRAEHAGKGDEADQRPRPVADGAGVHVNQLADVFAAIGDLHFFAVAVLHVHTKGEEDDGQHGAGDVADVEIEHAVAVTDRLVSLPRGDPERVDGGDFYRRRHPAHQGDNETERGKIPWRGFDEAFLHLHAFIDGDGDRSDGGDAQADDDDFREAVERLVAPHQQN